MRMFVHLNVCVSLSRCVEGSGSVCRGIERLLVRVSPLAESLCPCFSLYLNHFSLDEQSRSYAFSQPVTFFMNV